MNTKGHVLNYLNENRDRFVSGENLAEHLQVSRTAVWKAISHLREDGHRIEAVQNKGYRLVDPIDLLSAEGIHSLLEPPCSHVRIEVLDETESTNTLARQRARNGAPDGYAVIANAQTKGKGRRGKSFFSPPNTGLYLSLVLRPASMSIMQATKITTMAAVAACQAIEAVGNAEARIKWVNDVFVNGRKACGILTEASCDMESGCVDYAVLGVGINVYEPANGTPDNLATIMGHVLDERQPDGKNRLAAAFLNSFMRIYQSARAFEGSGASESPSTDYASEYRARCFVIGQPVALLLPDGEKQAFALDVDDDCRLIVRHEDGTLEALNSGEISVKLPL